MPVEGHEPGRILRHRGHEAAGQQRSAFAKALDLYKETTKYGPARRDQPRRRRHPQPVHLRPLRAVLSTGATSARSPSTRPRPRSSTRSAPPSCRARSRCSTATPASSHLHARILSPRRRRRQPCPVRCVRRLGRRHQRPCRSQGEGCGLCLLLLHGSAGAVECRRHDRQDRLQPLPHLPVQEPR